jgi:hypothetical protein
MGFQIASDSVPYLYANLVVAWKKVRANAPSMSRELGHDTSLDT